MITLITGVPGAGKTLCLMSMLKNRKDLKGRPLYLDGVPEVNNDVIPHETVPEGETMQTWHKWAPTGAIIVIDEAQRVFRTRPSGSKVPDYVAELETHRHKGLDFFIITQHPRLIDSNVRALIGNHKHISKTQLGIRRIIEWQRCANPESKNDIKEGLASVYKLDKQCFGIYKSAEEHTKIKTARTKWIYVFPIAMLFVIGSLWFSISYLSTMLSPEAVKSTVQASGRNGADAAGTASAEPQAAATGRTPPDGSIPPPQEQNRYNPEFFTPVVDGQPWTAEAYNGRNKAVQTMPYPVGCIKSGNKCTCYTDQATPIKELEQSVCLDYVENGIFNPYKDLSRQQQAVAPVAEPEKG